MGFYRLLERKNTMTPSRAQPDLSTYAGRFGAHIRTIREKKKLTQQEVAAEIGTQDENLSRWESGKATPRFELIPLLAKALRVKHIKDLFPD